MTRSEKIQFIALRSVGNFLLLFAIYGVVATFGPTLYQEVLFRVNDARGVTYAVTEEQKPSFSNVDRPTQKPSTSFTDIFSDAQDRLLTPIDTSFGIVIPKIGANTKVFPNIEPDNEKAFLPVLQSGVAHAKGSVFPGLLGTTYIFAHSTDSWWNVGRYNAVFYLLKELKTGDDVVVFFEDRRYNYQVKESYIANASDVTRLTQSQTSQEQLVLQTCWPPGTTWKRLFVVAEPK